MSLASTNYKVHHNKNRHQHRRTCSLQTQGLGLKSLIIFPSFRQSGHRTLSPCHWPLWAKQPRLLLRIFLLGCLFRMQSCPSCCWSSSRRVTAGDCYCPILAADSPWCADTCCRQRPASWGRCGAWLGRRGPRCSQWGRCRVTPERTSALSYRSSYPVNMVQVRHNASLFSSKADTMHHSFHQKLTDILRIHRDHVNW